MKMRAVCISKQKDKYGNITEYKIQFSGGVIQNVKPDFLKAKMSAGEWNVLNLKFTSNGRLIDVATQNKPTPMPVSKPKTTIQPTSTKDINPMQFVGEHSRGLVQATDAKKQQQIRQQQFIPENMGAVYSKFEEIIEQHPHNPWKTARETDKMNWTRIIWKRWLQDNNTDIVFEITKVIQNYQKTLPKHRYNVAGYGHYSIDKDKFIFEDTVDNVKYDYSMLCRAVKNYCEKRGRKVRPDIIEDWVLNLTAQAVDADTDDDIEEIVQSLMNESYID